MTRNGDYFAMTDNIEAGRTKSHTWNNRKGDGTQSPPPHTMFLPTRQTRCPSYEWDHGITTEDIETDGNTQKKDR